jgi:choline transporter-like protein 2/4/5
MRVLCALFRYSLYVLIFQVITFVWLVYFVSAIGELVLAGAFGSYYWAFKKPDDIPALPLLSAVGTTFR